ncbi:MAG: glycosyltransferase [Lachnospiraceae bacterium]
MEKDMLGDYSVLMSVYSKENAEHFRKSMESMFSQSVLTNDFVLVCDGPVGTEIENVIECFKKKYKEILHVIPLQENKGLGNALKIGLLHCKNEFVARMDSDDIAKTNRCERELEVFCKHPEISIVGSTIAEFIDEPDNIVSIRIVPEQSEEILQFAKKRNPFNHPSVMFRRSAVMNVGNYSTVRFIQDYYLWIDLLCNGYKGYNIQEPLVLVRTGNDLYKRRSGKEYAKIQVNLFTKMRNLHFISTSQWIKACILRVGSSLAPNWMRKYLFGKILRRS